MISATQPDGDLAFRIHLRVPAAIAAMAAEHDAEARFPHASIAHLRGAGCSR